AGAAGYRTFSARIKGLMATGDGVTGNYFGVAGVRAALGRTLLSDDDFAPAIVLSHDAWANWFGADSSVVGQSILLGGTLFRVVGVAQEHFAGFFKKPRDFWIPLRSVPRQDTARAPATTDEKLSLLVRLAPGTSAGQGRAFFMSVLQSATAREPDSARVLRVFLTSRATAIAPSASAIAAFSPLIVAFGLILAL